MDINIKIFDILKSHKYNDVINIIKKNENININIRDNTNSYLIQYAVLFNNIELVNFLISKSCKLDIYDLDNRCILYTPIKLNYNDILESLLKYDNDIIGVSLNDLKDSNGHYSIHYTIFFKNITALKLLIKYGSNLDKLDKDNNNILYYAIKYKDIEIFNEIIKITENINHQNNNGETVLHLACNFNNIDFVDKLLENNINVNIKDFNSGILPIMYSIISFNNEIFYKLLKDTNVNIQDNYGNTCLHYCIFEKNYDFINSILDKEVDYNITNIKGKTVLHLILDNFNERYLSNYDLGKIIKYTNLNIQDYFGNSCFLLLCKNNLWFKYKDIIEKKKINYLLKNFNKENCLNFIKDEDFGNFYDMLTNSYLNYIRNDNTNFTFEILNLCKKNLSYKKFIESKDIDKYVEEYGNILNKSSRDVCYDLIKSLLKKNDIPYPYRIIFSCIENDDFDNSEIISFSGSTLDLISGLIYLHRNLSNISTSLDLNFYYNQELQNYLLNSKNKLTKMGDFINFEITWDGNSLFFPTIMNKTIQKFKESSNQFYIIPLAIILETGAHSNILIYDKQLNEMERFEPNGSVYPYKFNYFPKKLDDKLQIIFSDIFIDLKYISPFNYIPTIGLQTLELNDYDYKYYIGDPGGFCATWCIFYAYMRCKNPKIDKKDLFNSIINKTREKNILFKNLIRRYAKYIITIRDEFLSLSKLNVNKWLNLEFSENQYNELVTNLKKEIGSY